VTVIGAEVLVCKSELPEYWAVIESMAIGGTTDRVACPLLRVAVPRDVPLAKNWTVPVAVPAPGLFTATIAVRVTNSKGAGLAFDAETVVVVVANTTANVLTAEVLPA
jgi:hypothetical protein